MYITIKKKNGDMRYVEWVNPEDIAVANTETELLELLFEKIKSKWPDDNALFDKDTILVSVLNSETEKVDYLDVYEYWNRFAEYFPEWRRVGEKIKTAMKEYEGNNTYWQLDPEFLYVDERKIDDDYQYDFRHSVLSGNCFRTKEEAEAFLETVKQLFKSVHEEGETPDSINAKYAFCGCESIRYYCWDYDGSPQYPLHPVYCMQPMKFHGADDFSDDEIAMWNFFSNEEQLKEVYFKFYDLFKARGFAFPGLNISWVYD